MTATKMGNNALNCFLVRVTSALAWFAGLCLVLFTLRRWVFLLVNVFGREQDRKWAVSEPEHVLLLVPFKNELAALPDLLHGLEQLDYPAEKLLCVLVDDASTDGSSQIAQQWVQAGANRFMLSLPNNVGKPAALNEAMARFPQGDLVAVYDADERPAPDVLTILCRPFADASVGAVSGRRAISNPLASPIASHVTFENLVHQLVTMQAKERLNLAPALLGSNCIYRRQALADVGYFLPGALLEDSDLTLRLARAGWRTHFVPEAVSYYAAPETIISYWQQHLRWTVGFQTVARQQGSVTLRSRNLDWPLRMELLAFSLGYLDRLALLLTIAWAGTKLLASRRVPLPLLSLLLASLLTPLFQVVAALFEASAPAALWRRIIWLPLFLLLEIVVALVGLLPKRRFARPATIQ